MLLVYLDDVIIFSGSIQELFERMGTVFSKLAEVGLKLKSKKCHPFQQQIVYLGHVVGPLGISTENSGCFWMKCSEYSFKILLPVQCVISTYVCNQDNGIISYNSSEEKTYCNTHRVNYL